MVSPVNNPQRPVCRYFFKKKCSRGDKCRFYHPPRITRTIKKRARRPIGKCYCGSELRTIMNNTPIRYGPEDEERPTFYRVCARTRKSIKRCMVWAPLET